MAIIIIWILVIVCLAIIAFVIMRKFTVLASIDISNIEAEKQAEVKKRIISEKFQRDVNKWLNKVGRFLLPLLKAINNFCSWLYRKLLDLKSKYTRTDLQSGPEDPNELEALFSQAQDFLHHEDLLSAENKFIEIIGLDSKNFKAFQSLGELYLERENYQEAEQTLRHAVKLKQSKGEVEKDLELGNVFFNLSIVHQEQNDNAQAISNLRLALKQEPNNPRYLDRMIELSLNVKNKGDAYEFFKKLEQANPENQKLAEFKRRIMDL